MARRTPVSTFNTRNEAVHDYEMIVTLATILRGFRFLRMLDRDGHCRYIQPVARLLQGTRILFAELTTTAF
jgi:hypothetical protein